MRRVRDSAVLVLGLSLPAFGCKPAPQTFTTTVQVMQVRTFGGGQTGGQAGGPAGQKLTDLDLKFVDCPGNARQILRAPREFSECGTKLKVGDKLKAEVLLTYNAERGVYRNELTKLGSCALKLDPKDEANYQMVENCSEVKATGVTVGVRCERGRTPALVAKCPWLRRN
ncbi:MAG TPA: hypothetical protein VFZ53_29435 [Polyangiaceae bacterium]